MKSFNEYQEFTKSLAAYNTNVHLMHPYTAEMNASNQPMLADIHMPYTYPAMAIAEEAGEVVGKIAKFVRKSKQGLSVGQVVQLKTDVAKELGDVLYQVSETARQFGYSLQDIVDMNVTKLTDRKERGVLVGEGDDR